MDTILLPCLSWKSFYVIPILLLACGYPVFPNPFVEEEFLSPLHELCSTDYKLENLLLALCSILLIWELVSILMLLFFKSLWLCSIKWRNIPPNIIFLRMALTIQGVFWFHTNFIREFPKSRNHSGEAVDRSLAWTVTDLAPIPGVPHGPLTRPGMTPECRANINLSITVCDFECDPTFFKKFLLSQWETGIRFLITQKFFQSEWKA